VGDPVSAGLRSSARYGTHVGYEEALAEVKPTLIVETGTRSGGSVHFLAPIFDLADEGRIVTVDVDEAPKRPGIRRSLCRRIFPGSRDHHARDEAAERKRVLVVLE
jgi:cephalosporin hydroxylase